jgi:predicted TIM-barrel fold metal-dependent hydrolase
MIHIPKIISTDDHVVEPAHLWTSRVPKKYSDVAPRIVRQGISDVTRVEGRQTFTQIDDGRPCDWWLYEDLRRPITREYAAAGALPGEDLARGITFDEMPLGFYESSARVADMEINGVEASLCFPNVLPRFCGQTFLEAKDRELALLCVKAYNDWMVEEWSGPSGGRLIPLQIVPLWSAELAAEEVYRNASRGVRAVTFSELPVNLGLPSIHDKDAYWEPFMGACSETSTTICMHIGSSSRAPSTSPDAPHAVCGMLMSMNAMASMCDWLWSGVLHRHPNLKIAYSEGNIGWIPYILERADRLWMNQDWMFDRAKTPEPPSTYYAEHIFGCYISDAHGLQSLDVVGEDNVTFETDFPHTDGTWPRSVEVAERELGHLTQSQVDKIVRSNAIRMLSLEVPVA